MLRSVKQLYGEALGTSEGPIGHVKDFYFDDRHWTIRYVVVDTGSWLPGRLVLLSPQAFGDLYQDGDSLLVNLTRQQIEDSPAIETHKTVSRQYEEEYFRHYGWPSYWMGDGLSGASGFPVLPPPHLVPMTDENRGGGSTNHDDPHLRGTKEITGYEIQTPEGAIGHVKDLTMDDRSWEIRNLVVETGHWYAGKEIVLFTSQIDRIGHAEAKVFVNVTKDAIRTAPDYLRP